MSPLHLGIGGSISVAIATNWLLGNDGEVVITSLSLCLSRFWIVGLYPSNCGNDSCYFWTDIWTIIVWLIERLDSWLFSLKECVVFFLEYHLFNTLYVIVINIYIYLSLVLASALARCLSRSLSHLLTQTNLKQPFCLRSFSSGEDSSVYVCVCAFVCTCLCVCLKKVTLDCTISHQ